MKVVLRPMRPEDRDRVLAWRNADHVRANMYDDRIIDAQAHADWFAAALADPQRRDRIIMTAGRPVGLLSLYRIDEIARSCSWAFYIGEPGLTGQGLGSEVERLVLAQVFEEMTFDRLDCEVLETNAPVLRLHQRFGFRIYRRLPARAQRPDGSLDALELRLTRDDYKTWKSTTR